MLNVHRLWFSKIVVKFDLRFLNNSIEYKREKYLVAVNMKQ